MKLIKIEDDHYVVVDDSQIKNGDYFLYQFGDCPEICQNDGFGDPNKLKNCKKITHSTIPKGMMLMEGIERLSLQEVKELIGEVDVEKFAYNESEKEYEFSTGWEDYKKGITKGYNRALEDNKDKKYTEKDLRKAVMFGTLGKSFSNLIKILQPKTEWEVEFVNGKIKLK